MKKYTLFLVCCVFSALAIDSAMAAVAVKKAAPVATKESASQESVASLLPTVLSMVEGVKSLKAQQEALSAECEPTTTEVNWVNNMVKEWAKTGAKTANEAFSSLGAQRCGSSTGYAVWVRTNAEVDGISPCYDWFDETGAIWNQYPMATVTSYCTDGSIGSNCSAKYRKTMSNIYEVFNLVDFEPQDYTAAEAKNAGKILAKVENCSSAKLSAKKRAAWGEFLTGAIGTVGQKQNTGSIMQTVGGITSNGLSGGLSSIGSIASQFLDK